MTFISEAKVIDIEHEQIENLQNEIQKNVQFSMGSSIVLCKLHDLLDSIIQAIQKCTQTILKCTHASQKIVYNFCPHPPGIWQDSVWRRDV